MKLYLIFLIVLTAFNNINSQDHYISSIDIESKNQFARQIALDQFSNDHFILTVETDCIYNKSSCGGIVKVDEFGNIIDSILIEDFSTNIGALASNEDYLFLSGEFNMGSATSFSSLVINQNLNIDTIFNFFSDSISYYNYFATSSLLRDSKLFVGGSTFCGDRCQIGLGFVKSKDTVTQLEFNFVEEGYTAITQTFALKDGSFGLFTMYRDFNTDKDSIKIIRLDTAFNQTFEWSREVQDNAIPRGCVSYNNDMIITIPDDEFEETRNILSIDPTGQTNWIYEWPNKQGRTNILRIKEAKNHDLLVMGQILNPDILDDKRYVAFVMRLNSIGEQIWIRYFKIEDQDTRLRNYVSDLVELENGDLQLTGQSRRIVYDPEFGDFRPDQDIFWARIGGDGCINGDCSEVFLISNTNDLLPAIVDIFIHPNPIVDGQLNIDVNDHSVQSAWIYDLSGQLIMHKKLEYGSTSVSLEGNNSIYLLRIVDEEGRLVHSEKVIKL